VVDDDETTRLLAEQSLRLAGFDVALAEDGLAALDSFGRRRPDIVLLDVDMPRLDGFATCEALRDLPEGETLPILMATGLDDAGSVDRAYAAGATDFTTKPINWPLLNHRIRYLLRASDTLRKLSRTAAALAKSQASLDQAQRIAHLGNWEWDPRHDEMWWSDEVFRILGESPGKERVLLADWMARVHPDDRERVTSWFSEQRHPLGAASLVHRVLRPNDEERFVQHQTSPLYPSPATDSRLIGIVQDVTERMHAEQEVHRLAYYDGLTRLPNRESFRARLGQEIARCRREDSRLAVLFLDVDDFKRVNDTLGHSVGDQLLREMADRLRDCVRVNDVVGRQEPTIPDYEVARLGGDEFTLLLVGVKAPQEAANVALRVQARLSEPYMLSGNETFVTPSIGVSLFPGDGEDAETLIKNADTAMYSAKRAGKNQYQLYDAAMNAVAKRRMSLDNQLRKALDRGELHLVYQPQLDLASGDIEAAEALLRWTNRELGDVPPDEFIPVAEENGMIVTIGEWVLLTACTQARQWQEAGVPIGRVAVNISVAQFVQPSFADVIRRTLNEASLEPSRLELEVTESLLAKDVASATRTLNSLRELGVQLSIDDFGTGYSSMSHLKHFPVNRLKIDRSFVREVTSNADDAAITTAILSMAKSMRLGVIAEGVENLEQLRFLRESQCDLIQGYYVSRPVPFDKLVAFARAQERTRRMRQGIHPVQS
jgi:diguanylate cyclase (GGDEF)-like protein